MHRRRPLFGILLCAGTAVLPAQAGRPLAITGVTVVHPERSGAAAVEPDRTVVVADGRIRSVGSSASAVPAGAEVIDGKGRWLIPGLVDSHVHFFQSANPYTRPDGFDLTNRVPYAQEDARNRLRLPATFKVWLASGVTSVFDAGGPFWNFSVRDMARSSAAAPRVAIAGPLLSMVDDPKLDNGDPPIIKVTTPDEAVALAREELQRRPDYIKVWFIHRPNDDLAKQEAIVKAAADVAHGAGVPLAVHATELDTAKAALRAGADLLVHSVIDKPVDDEFLRLARERHVLYTPTLYVFQAGWEMASGNWTQTEIERVRADPQVLATMHDFEKTPAAELPDRLRTMLKSKGQPPPAAVADRLAIASRNLLAVWNAGITVAMGTDAGNPGVLHGPSIFREIALMQSAGLTPAQVLRAATTNGALVMRLDKELGRIAAGQLADMVLLDADPLADSANLARIRLVIKGGVAHDPNDLMHSISASAFDGAAVEKDVRAFLASYADDLRAGRRDAIAARYDPRGAYFVGFGMKSLMSAEQIRNRYATQWGPPKSFDWRDISVEPLSDDAAVVTGLFDWQLEAGQKLTFSYTALLTRQSGGWRIRLEDESAQLPQR